MCLYTKRVFLILIFAASTLTSFAQKGDGYQVVKPFALIKSSTSISDYSITKRIKFNVELDGEIKTLLLRKYNLTSPNYSVTNNSGTIKHNNTTNYFRGKVEGWEESRVYFSRHKAQNKLTVYKGDRIWSMNPNSTKKSHSHLRRTISQSVNKQIQCESNSHEKVKPLVNKTTSSKAQTSDTSISVDIYIEADYEMFLKNNSSIENTDAYIRSVFEQVAHIYARENIEIKISHLKVWDTQDPYNTTSANDGLTSFRQNLRSTFQGELAHLISGNSHNHGGKAFIDVLCDKDKAFGYSNMQGGYNGISDYSWDAFLMAHELGHNFGSRHTHECVWGPNGDQALDICGRSNETCEVMNSNPEHGTIMSYCHLDEIGISFEAGFGQEPGNVIRSKYNACKTDNGINCHTAIQITDNGKYSALGPVKGLGASRTNADHANWFKFEVPEDGRIKIFNCNSGIDSRLWIHVGQDCQSLTTIGSSDDDCGPVGQSEYSSSIPHLAVNGGETIYIEWDDRWSDDGFDFYFKFGPLSSSENIASSSKK